MSAAGPILVVPDVHLRIGVLRQVLDAWSDSGPVVFLGDFFDDFGDTAERNREMAVFLKEEILPRPSYTVLMGNHDLHYHPRCPSELWCSGFHPDKKKAIGEVLGAEDFSAFRWAHPWEGVLFTHAGLHPRLVPPFFQGGAEAMAGWISQTCEVALETRDPSEPLLRAGRIRGGYQPVGGVIWMDAREYQPVGEVRQIFGHTPLRKPMALDSKAEGSWCVDTNLECVAVLAGGKSGVQIIGTDGIESGALVSGDGKSLPKSCGGVTGERARGGLRGAGDDEWGGPSPR